MRYSAYYGDNPIIKNRLSLNYCKSTDRDCIKAPTLLFSAITRLSCPPKKMHSGLSTKAHLVRLPQEQLEAQAFSVVSGRRSFAGSNIGGIAETQEMLEFCAKHNNTAKIERINIQDVNTALNALKRTMSSIGL